MVAGVNGAALVGAGGITTVASTDRGLAVSKIAESSGASWLERRTDQAAYDPADGDRGGPVVVAAAADRSRVDAAGETRVKGGGPSIARTRLVAFTLAGCTAGMASILMTARLNSGSPNYGAGFELQAIGAAVIGGASLAGGYGNILSTLLGALTIVVVQNGLILNDVPTSWQQIVLGFIIVFAVGVDSWKLQIGALARRVLPPAVLRWSRAAPVGQAAGPTGRSEREVPEITGPRKEE